ncbi:dermonecrotic toxin domain-containing protein [Pseudomonas shirazensis]|uniref:dermonecrotic toxin domain-containing protein n=1 Tax=Pseudomonas shirazensis TaxID=2745494 RepID=UPI003461C225
MGTVPIHNALELQPERFAQLCRTLDVGGQYQALLQAIYFEKSITRSRYWRSPTSSPTSHLSN